MTLAACAIAPAPSGRSINLGFAGERVLDVLATAGAAKQAASKAMIQITHGTTIVAMPPETVIRIPRLNVRLQPDDVMTVLFQPISFTALGAIVRNEELPLETTGLTLAQGLGRILGLQDTRADVKGVFTFRLEPEVLAPARRARTKVTLEGKVPVIYRINMKDLSTFFIA